MSKEVTFTPELIERIRTHLLRSDGAGWIIVDDNQISEMPPFYNINNQLDTWYFIRQGETVHLWLYADGILQFGLQLYSIEQALYLAANGGKELLTQKARKLGKTCLVYNRSLDPGSWRRTGH